MPEDGWLGSSLRRKGMGFIVLAVLSVALVRSAIAYIYPSQADWDE